MSQILLTFLTSKKLFNIFDIFDVKKTASYDDVKNIVDVKKRVDIIFWLRRQQNFWRENKHVHKNDVKKVFMSKAFLKNKFWRQKVFLKSMTSNDFFHVKKCWRQATFWLEVVMFEVLRASAEPLAGALLEELEALPDEPALLFEVFLASASFFCRASSSSCFFLSLISWRTCICALSKELRSSSQQFSATNAKSSMPMFLSTPLAKSARRHQRSLMILSSCVSEMSGIFFFTIARTKPKVKDASN